MAPWCMAMPWYSPPVCTTNSHLSTDSQHDGASRCSTIRSATSCILSKRSFPLCRVRARTAAAGNTVQILEVSASEAQSRWRSNKQLWRDIHLNGVVIHGLTIRELSDAIHA